MPGLRWCVGGLLCVMGWLVAGAAPAQSDTATTAVFGWGLNSRGQIGVTQDYRSAVSGVIRGTEAMVSISAGDEHALGVKSDGTVWGWGSGYFGRLGNETPGDYREPIQIPGLSDVVSVAAGVDHSLAVKSDGTVWAWGSGAYGKLGYGDIQAQRVPVQVVGLTDVIDVAASSPGSMALKRDGTVWVWGAGHHGLLGNGSTDSSYIPVQVSNLTNVVAITAALGNHVALKADGTVWWWGSGASYASGRVAASYIGYPVQVPLTDIVAIDGGGQHILALQRGGRVWAWGGNSFGQLGDGNKTYQSAPVLVRNLTDVIAVSAGGNHSAALKADGSLWTWGASYYGQLGTDDEYPLDWYAGVSFPTRAAGLPGITHVDLGGDYTLARALFVKVPPEVWLQGPLTVNEASGFTFNPLVVSRSSPGGLSYRWDFGDGRSSTAANPEISYPDDGVYTVRLTVTDSAGLSGSATTTVQVNNVAPTGTIYDPPSGIVSTVGSELELRASVRDVTSADTLTARWIFTASDGTEIVVPGELTIDTGRSDGPVGIATVRHRFTALGSYTVRLEVTDDDGGVGTATTVQGQPAVVNILPLRDGAVSGSGRIRVGNRNDTKFRIAVKVRRGKPSGVVQISHGGPRIKLKAKDIETVAIGSDGVAHIRARGRNRSGEYLVYLTVVDGKPDRVRLRMVPQFFPSSEPVDNQPHLGLGDLPGADAAVMLGQVFVRAH